MEHLLLLGLSAAILFAAAGSLFPNRPQPPQIIYVQTSITDQPSGDGCLPLIILVVIVLAAITLL